MRGYRLGWDRQNVGQMASFNNLLVQVYIFVDYLTREVFCSDLTRCFMEERAVFIWLLRMVLSLQKGGPR